MINTNKSTQIIVKGALLIALALVLSYFEFPIIPAVPWLQLDFSLIPILLGALALGPIAGLSMTLILQLLIALLNSKTFGVGQIANFIVMGTLIIIVSLFYKAMPNKKGLLLGLIFGSLGFTLAAVIANKFILVPLFFPEGFPQGQDALNAYLFKFVPLFNLIKGFANGLLALLAYSRLGRFLNVESARRHSLASTNL